MNIEILLFTVISSIVFLMVTSIYLIFNYNRINSQYKTTFFKRRTTLNIGQTEFKQLLKDIGSCSVEQQMAIIQNIFGTDVIVMMNVNNEGQQDFVGCKVRGLGDEL